MGEFYDSARHKQSGTGGLGQTGYAFDLIQRDFPNPNLNRNPNLEGRGGSSTISVDILKCLSLRTLRLRARKFFEITQAGPFTMRFDCDPAPSQLKRQGDFINCLQKS
jgi:hypothetical protein